MWIIFSLKRCVQARRYAENQVTVPNRLFYFSSIRSTMSTVTTASSQQYSTYAANTSGTGSSKNNASQGSNSSDNSSQNRYEDSYESSSGNAATTYSQQTGVKSRIGESSPSTLSPEAQARAESQLKASMQMMRIGWENDVDFSTRPTTAEGKKAWNDLVMQFATDDRFKSSGMLPPVLGSLNRVDGTDWMIADGAEALLEHDVLGILKSNNVTSGSSYNEYGHVNQAINEYGYAATMPGRNGDTNYLTGILVASDGTEKTVPILGMDGGKTYAPEIKYLDAMGLGGMSLADRKSFLSTAQNILNQAAPGLDVRQLNFTVGFKTDEDMRNNNYSLLLDSPSGRIADEREAIENALNADKSLVDMMMNAKSSGNKTAGEYTISVLDSAGNALAKNEIILSAGDKSVRTTVDTIDGMDHQQILNFINNGTIEKTEKTAPQTAQTSTATSGTTESNSTSESSQAAQSKETSSGAAFVLSAKNKPSVEEQLAQNEKNGAFRINPEQLERMLRMDTRDETDDRRLEKGFEIDQTPDGDFIVTVNDGLVDGKTGKEVGSIGEYNYGPGSKYLKFQDFIDPNKLDGSLGYEAVNGYLTQLVDDIRSGTATYRPGEFYNARNTGTGGNQTGGQVLFNIRMV